MAEVDGSRPLTRVYRKSSYSQAHGNCVEVSYRRGLVHVRDSKRPGGGVLTFRPGAWRDFVHGLAAGEFRSFGG